MGMTIDDAIKHCEEVAEEQDKLCKQYDDASRYARSHNKDIVSANAKKCLECFECAKEHGQLAEWLRDYKEMSLAIEEIKSLGQSRRILLMKGDEVLHLVEDIIDRHISGKENI